MRHNPLYIDLFAGCGGLSLGLQAAGFSRLLSVEKSPMAAETYYHNFIKKLENDEEWPAYLAKGILQQAKAGLVVSELENILNSKEVLSYLQGHEVDLIAGGPPCQGFSLAGRRNPADVRNKLPWQFLELVEKLNPRAVIIENVAGIGQDFKKHNTSSPFQQLRLALESTGSTGYMVQPVLLNAMFFGVAQHRPRMMLLAIRKDLAQANNLSTTSFTWNSKQYVDLKYVRQEMLPLHLEKPQLVPAVSHYGDTIYNVADALSDLPVNKPPKKYVKNTSYNQQLKELERYIVGGSPNGELKNHVLRNHQEWVTQRFRFYQLLSAKGIDTKILNLAGKFKKEKSGFDAYFESAKNYLVGLSFPLSMPGNELVIESKRKLLQLTWDLATKKHSQRPLKWNEPSPTVVSIPDDFVHPSAPRTLTVRELARFQSFPDNFEFRSKETTGGLRRRTDVPQYTQVGNAVPPLLGKAVGETLIKFLKVNKSLATG